MDTRDRALLRHHAKRIHLAEALPMPRQLQWAQREARLARIQHRFLMLTLAMMWLHNIKVTP